MNCAYTTTSFVVPILTYLTLMDNSVAIDLCGDLSETRVRGIEGTTVRISISGTESHDYDWDGRTWCISDHWNGPYCTLSNSEKYKSTTSVDYDPVGGVSVLYISLNSTLHDSKVISRCEEPHFVNSTTSCNDHAFSYRISLEVVKESDIIRLSGIRNEGLELYCSVKKYEERFSRWKVYTIKWQQNNFDKNNSIETIVRHSNDPGEGYRWKLQLSQGLKGAYIFCAVGCYTIAAYQVTTVYVHPNVTIRYDATKRQITCTTESGDPAAFNMDFTHSIPNHILRHARRRYGTISTTITWPADGSYQSAGIYTCNSTIANNGLHITNNDTFEISADPYIIEPLPHVSVDENMLTMRVYSLKEFYYVWVYHENVTNRTNSCIQTNSCKTVDKQTDITSHSRSRMGTDWLKFFNTTKVVDVRVVTLPLDSLPVKSGGYFTFTVNSTDGTTTRNITYRKVTPTPTTEIGLPTFVWVIGGVLVFVLCVTGAYLAITRIRLKRNTQQSARTQQDNMKGIIAKRNMTAMGAATNQEYFSASDHDYSELDSVPDAYEVPTVDASSPYLELIENDEYYGKAIIDARGTVGFGKANVNDEPQYAKIKNVSAKNPYEMSVPTNDYGDYRGLVLKNESGEILVADRGVPDGGAAKVDDGAKTTDGGITDGGEPMAETTF